MFTNITNAILGRAKDYPEATAMMTPGKADTTFGELDAHIDAVRHQLADFGIDRGDRVGLVVPERDSMATSYLSVMSLTSAAPLSALTTPDELAFSIGDFGLKYVILEDGLTELHDRARSLGIKVIALRPDRQKTGYFTLTGDGVRQGSEPGVAMPDDVAVLLHTSGTTSRPKIVPRTHQFTLSKLDRDRGDIQLHRGDRVVDVLPMHHTQGLNAELITPLVNGATVVMATFNPKEFILLLETYRPTKFTLVPSMHNMVVDHVPADRELPLDLGLRWVDSSSAKLSVDLRKRMEKIYGVPVREGYGATEVDRMVILGLSRDGVPEGSVGKRAHDGLVIMDPDGKILPPGEVGEVCVVAERTIGSYENNPEANAAAFRDGYYRTGDQGYLDENDFLFVLGRVSESINRGGEKIAPTEIDDVLVTHPGIYRAAAFGVSSTGLGQEVWAAVVPEQGVVLNANEVRAFASASLSFPKVPKRVIMVDELPYNQIGKVMRRELTRRYDPAGS